MEDKKTREIASIDMKEIEEAVLAAAQGYPEKLVQMFALVTAELKAVAHIVHTADGVYQKWIGDGAGYSEFYDGPPKEVTAERIDDFMISHKLKTLLFDMTYDRGWIYERVKRNKTAIEKILQHVDLHGNTPPTL